MKKEVRISHFRFCALYICALLLTLACSGCTGGFDAGEYVTAVLDNFYQDNSTKLVEIADIPADEAHQIYLDGLATEAKIFYSYMSFHSSAIDEHTEQRVTDLYASLYNRARYEIVSAKKSGDSYSVVVRVSPIDIFVQSIDELNLFVTAFYEEIASGHFAGKSEAEMNADFQNAILQILENRMYSIGYLEPVELTVQVSQDGNGSWGMSNEDFQKIDTDIIRY